LRLPIPDGIQAEDAAAISVGLYDRSKPGFPAAGSTIVPLVERERRYEEPRVKHRVGATFGDQIQLLGYDLIQDASSLRLVLHWRAQAQVADDYVVFVHLYDPKTETIVAQSDARPLNGTYPTNWWRVQEIVSDEALLPIADVPAGTYRLAIGIYEVDTEVRPPVVTASGETLPDGRLVLEQELRVPIR
jgi:hypothetical protein